MRILLYLLIGIMLGACQGSASPGETNSGNAPDSTGIEWESPIRVASGEAYQGPWRMNDSDFRYVDDPTVAMTKGGRIFTAWADQAGQDVYLQVFDPDGTPMLEEPANVSGSPDTFSWLPRLAVDDEGRRVHVLWQEILFTGGSHGGEILYACSRDGGETFSEPVNLSDTPAGAGKGRLSRERWSNGSLDLALGDDGTLVAAWSEYEGALRVSVSEDGGTSFSEPRTVVDDPRSPARGPSLALADGAMHLAWTVGEDPEADIRLASTEPGSLEFGEPQTIHGDSGHADAPRLATDENGDLHLVWSRAPEGPTGSYQVVHTTIRDGSPETDSPTVLSGQTGAAFPHPIISGEHLLVAWEAFPDRGARPRGLGFAHSTDGGTSFSDPARLPDPNGTDGADNGGRQGLLMNKLATDDQGRIAVVHSTFQEGQTSDIWLFRGGVH